MFKLLKGKERRELKFEGGKKGKDVFGTTWHYCPPARGSASFLKALSTQPLASNTFFRAARILLEAASLRPGRLPSSLERCLIDQSQGNSLLLHLPVETQHVQTRHCRVEGHQTCLRLAGGQDSHHLSQEATLPESLNSPSTKSL